MSNVIKVGAGIVIIQDGKTLLAKRKGAHAQGHWGSMGGKLVFGETPAQAAVREAREELGIEVGNLRFVCCMNLKKDGEHYVDFSFVGELLDGEPQIMEPDKVAEIGWFSLDDLPTPLYEPVRAVLDAVKTGQAYYEFNV